MLTAHDDADDRVTERQSGWLSSAALADPDSVTLVCVPPAGGGNATFRGWQRQIGNALSVRVVQLPGRGTRLTEPARGTLHELADALADALAVDVGDRPFAMFGHSFGALLAYEAAGALGRHGDPVPEHVVIASAPAPSAAADRLRRELTENDPVALIRRMGAIPPQLLSTPGFVDLVAPIIRADCALLADYRPSGAVLDCPLTVLAGSDDPMIDAASVAEWQRYTSAGCHVAMFPGGHFFYRDRLTDVLDVVRWRVFSTA